MIQGKCVWFNARKGFGFLRDDETGKDHFCHWSVIRGMTGYKELKADQKVSYDLETGPQGKPQATNVFVIE